MINPTRRDVLASAGAGVVGLPLASTLAQDQAPAPKRLKVVVVGGHPDDPESGCGGKMARLADLGHDVVALYLTRGEEGIEGKGHDEAAKVRTAEVASPAVRERCTSGECGAPTTSGSWPASRRPCASRRTCRCPPRHSGPESR